MQSFVPIKQSKPDAKRLRGYERPIWVSQEAFMQQKSHSQRQDLQSTCLRQNTNLPVAIHQELLSPNGRHQSAPQSHRSSQI